MHNQLEVHRAGLISAAMLQGEAGGHRHCSMSAPEAAAATESGAVDVAALSAEDARREKLKQVRVQATIPRILL